jgi:hypothetical protein
MAINRYTLYVCFSHNYIGHIIKLKSLKSKFPKCPKKIKCSTIPVKITWIILTLVTNFYAFLTTHWERVKTRRKCIKTRQNGVFNASKTR